MNLYLWREFSVHSQQRVCAVEKLQCPQGILPLQVMACDREIRVGVGDIYLQGTLVASLCPRGLTPHVGRETIVDQAKGGATLWVSIVDQIRDSHGRDVEPQSAKQGASQVAAEPQRETHEQCSRLMRKLHEVGPFLNKLPGRRG